MPKTHSSYPPEFRRRMVELVRSGKTPEALARQYEPSGQTIRNWVRQADRDEGRRGSGVTVYVDGMRQESYGGPTPGLKWK